MIGRIICQSYVQMILVDELDHAMHELGASAVVFWSVIEIDDKGVDIGKTMSKCLPQLM